MCTEAGQAERTMATKQMQASPNRGTRTERAGRFFARSALALTATWLFACSDGDATESPGGGGSTSKGTGSGVAAGGGSSLGGRTSAVGSSGGGASGPELASCTHYASPRGGGDGSSAASPFSVAEFWPIAQPA